MPFLSLSMCHITWTVSIPISHRENLSRKKHKEEQKYRHVMDAQDWGLIDAEVEKYPHPFDDQRPHLYNPPADVNVADSLSIGAKMESRYIANLPDGFYNPISSLIKTISILKKLAKGNKGRAIIDPSVACDWSAATDGAWASLCIIMSYALCHHHHSLMSMAVSAKPTSLILSNASVCLMSCQQPLISSL